MKMIWFWSTCVFLIGLSYGLEFPPYIKRCKIEEFKTCAPEAANLALPYILEGDERYNFPSFYPLQLGKTEFDEPHLKFILKNCKLHGFKSIHVDKVTWNNPIVAVEFTMNQLSLTGEYPAGSKFFDAYLARPGVANFTLENGRYRIEVLFIIKLTDKGERQLIPYKSAINLQPNSTRVTFSDSLNETPYLSLENSNIITKEVMLKFQAALYRGVLEIVGKLVRKYPVEVFYIPKYY